MNVLRTGNKVPNKGTKVPKMLLANDKREMSPIADINKNVGVANLFRVRLDGRLDRGYLRTCAVYKLLKQGRIDKARGIELLAQRRGAAGLATVEIWLNGPLSPKGRKNFS